MKIRIITVGKLKESYWVEAEAEYKKRLSPWANIEIIEIKETPFSEKDPAEIIQKKEAEKILAHLRGGGNGGENGAKSGTNNDEYIIALDSAGHEYTSEEFANAYNQKWLSTGQKLVFIIGGPRGLHQSILQKSHTTLSLSRLTFTHQMVRTFLLEQLYRAHMITAHRAYHY